MWPSSHLSPELFSLSLITLWDSTPQGDAVDTRADGCELRRPVQRRLCRAALYPQHAMERLAVFDTRPVLVAVSAHRGATGPLPRAAVGVDRLESLAQPGTLPLELLTMPVCWCPALEPDASVNHVYVGDMVIVVSRITDASRNEWNAMRRPDPASQPWGAVNLGSVLTVSADPAGPVRVHHVYLPVWASCHEVNAMRRPSGDQLGGAVIRRVVGQAPVRPVPVRVQRHVVSARSSRYAAIRMRCGRTGPATSLVQLF